MFKTIFPLQQLTFDLITHMFRLQTYTKYDTLIDTVTRTNVVIEINVVDLQCKMHPWELICVSKHIPFQILRTI
jgi:hypothetical protein